MSHYRSISERPVQPYQSMYRGSAKGMEGHNVLRALEQLKKANFTIKGVVKDKDGECMEHVHKVFGASVIEYLDLGHAAGAFEKRIKNNARLIKGLVFPFLIDCFHGSSQDYKETLSI